MCTGNDSCILTFIVEISLVQLKFVLLTLQGGRKCHFNVLFHSQFSVQIINKYEKKYVRQYCVGGEPHAVFQLLKWGHLTITFPEGDTLFFGWDCRHLLLYAEPTTWNEICGAEFTFTVSRYKMYKFHLFVIQSESQI